MQEKKNSEDMSSCQNQHARQESPYTYEHLYGQQAKWHLSTGPFQEVKEQPKKTTPKRKAKSMKKSNEDLAMEEQIRKHQ